MERIDLRHVGHEVHRRWVRGKPGEIGHAVITAGQLVSRDWFVAQTERGITMAWIACNEQHATDVVQRWIKRRGGSDLWRQIEVDDAAQQTDAVTPG